MTVVVDAAPLVALADTREPRRRVILDLLEAERRVCSIPAPVTAEIDDLLGQRFGPLVRRASLEDLCVRRYERPNARASSLSALITGRSPNGFSR